MAKNKNISSANPRLKKYKKISKELGEIIVADGHGSLFSAGQTVRTPAAQRRWDTKKHLVVKQALELGLHVPQALIDDVIFGDPDRNPPTPPEDTTEPPF